MAGFFQTYGTLDLALGKPGIHGLPISATVGDALCMLRDFGVGEITVWDYSGSGLGSINRPGIRKWECPECHCLGKVNFLDIICYYASQERIEAASKDPVSVLLSPAKKNHIRHLDPHSRLTDVFNLVLDGAQCFLVPLDTRRTKSVKVASSVTRKSTTTIEKYKRMDYCWLTQEDVLRFLLGCIGVFSPMPMTTIAELGIIDQDVMFVDANSKASKALPLMIQASHKMTAVAVVEEDEEEADSISEHGRLKLVGDISLASLGNCRDETAALALASLSISDFMTYIQDAAGAPQQLKELILAGLDDKSSKNDRNYERIKLGLTDLLSSDTDSHGLSSDLSSDDETASSTSSFIPRSAAKFQRACPSSPLCCHPWSSLVAVMAQALAFRRTYLWVTDDDHTLIGMVTYLDMIRVLLKHI